MQLQCSLAVPCVPMACAWCARALLHPCVRLLVCCPIASPASPACVAKTVDDLVSLTHLHEASILHVLCLRFSANAIYTYTGPILLALNPFKPLLLFTEVPCCVHVLCVYAYCYAAVHCAALVSVCQCVSVCVALCVQVKVILCVCVTVPLYRTVCMFACCTVCTCLSMFHCAPV